MACSESESEAVTHEGDCIGESESLRGGVAIET